ncbi:MAG: hypothetical protein CMH25_00565 [Micavibrio sp.]|nr:hypothetical protein [Micavibrio sp.]|tara:strand:- start:113257 stop:114804 length:1548 start_codon:yes stop_codon:yes gene_type:complete
MTGLIAQDVIQAKRPPPVSLRRTRTAPSIQDHLLTKHAIPRHFPKLVTSEARHLTASKTALEETLDTYRRDTLDIPFVTIDPRNAISLDDAIYVEKQSDGSWYTATALTDVASAVAPDTHIDREAFQRASTFHVYPKVIRMLPHVISENSSSLLPRVTRPALIFEAKYSPDGEMLSQEFSHGLIRSRKKHSYESFHEWVSRGHRFAIDIVECHDILKRQSSNADSAYRSRNLIIDDHRDDIEYCEESGRNAVSEFMLRVNANMSTFVEEAGVPQIYRVNGPGYRPEDYKKARIRLRELGYALPKNARDCSWQILSDIVEESHVQGNSDAVIRILQERIASRSFFSANNTGHFTLGVDRYALFSSPLQRYSDIFNQRAMHTALGKTGFGLSQIEIENIHSICGQLNQNDEVRRRIRRDRRRYELLKEMKSLEGQRATFFVADINERAVDFLVPSNGLRVAYTFNEQSGTTAEKLDNNSFRVSRNDDAPLTLSRRDRVRLQIESVDPLQGEMKVCPF